MKTSAKSLGLAVGP